MRYICTKCHRAKYLSQYKKCIKDSASSKKGKLTNKCSLYIEAKRDHKLSTWKRQYEDTMIDHEDSGDL